MTRSMAMMPRDFDIITHEDGEVNALNINRPYTSIMILVDGTTFDKLVKGKTTLTQDERDLIGGQDCIRGEVYPAAWRTIKVKSGAIAAFRD